MNCDNFDDALADINNNPIPFFNTPFFRGYIHELKEAHSKVTQEPGDFIQKKVFIQKTIVTRLFSVASNSRFIHSVWPDATVDRYRNNIDLLGTFISLSFFDNNPGLVEWCREKMRPATFLRMIRVYMRGSDLHHTNTHLKDTFTPLADLIARKIDVNPPSRWRLDTFHDHVNAIHIEASTENVEFTDNSTKEAYTKDKYRVYQPKDKVELIKWSRKVHNCVHSYDPQILRRESEIFFIEESGVPRYTVEVDFGPIDKGHVTIKQLQASGKKAYSSTSDENKLCQGLIEEALGIRK